MVISLRSKCLTRPATCEEEEEKGMKGSQASLQPRAPGHPCPSSHLVNELFVYCFDLHTHGHPREPPEHVLQTHHAPVCPVCKVAWVGCARGLRPRWVGWSGNPTGGTESQRGREGRRLTLCPHWVRSRSYLVRSKPPAPPCRGAAPGENRGQVTRRPTWKHGGSLGTVGGQGEAHLKVQAVHVPIHA